MEEEKQGEQTEEMIVDTGNVLTIDDNHRVWYKKGMKCSREILDMVPKLILRV